MQLTRDQVNTIIKNAPAGTDKYQLLDGLIMRGYDIEGVDSNARRKQLQGQQESNQSTPVEQSEGNYFSQVGENIKSSFLRRGQQLSTDIQRTPELARKAGDSPLAKAVSVGVTAGHTAGNIAGGVGDIIGSFIAPLIPEVATQKIGTIAQKINEEIDKTGIDEDVKRSIGDLFNVLALRGLEKAEPKIKESVNSTIKSGKQTIRNAQTVIGEKVGTVKNKIVRTPSQKALDAITPKVKDVTKGEYEQLVKQQRIIPKTTTSPAKYILSEREKITAQKYQHILQSDDPIQNSNNVLKEIANKDAEVSNFLKQNNTIFNVEELKNTLKERLDDVTDITVDEAKLIKNKRILIDNFIKSLEKNNVESLWQARKLFDKQIEKAFSGSKNLQSQMKRTLRNAVQDFIANKTPEGVYKEAMKDMSGLFEIQDSLFIKAFKERGRSTLKEIYKQYQTEINIIGGMLGVGGALNILKGD